MRARRSAVVEPLTAPNPATTRWVPVGPSTAAVVVVPAGTSFPGSPVDGQEYIYAADVANGVFWRFYWHAATSKWVFVGGPPLVSLVFAIGNDTAETTTSTAYAALTTPGPSITLPFAGDYDVKISFNGTVTVQGCAARMAYDIGATPASDNQYATLAIPDTGGGQGSTGACERTVRLTGLGAVTLTAKYKVSQSGAGQTAYFRNRAMFVWPVRK